MLAIVAGCSADPETTEVGSAVTSPAPSSSTTTSSDAPTSTTTSEPEGTRAAARWETVATFTGSGADETDAFAILPDAIQWRVRFTCEGEGTYTLTTTPAPRREGPIGEGPCPGEDAFAIHTGEIRLGVEANGPWTAIVDQQVDAPLDEAPLDAMATATVTSEGSFYDLDMTGTGTARLYEAPDGARYLRLEGFETAANTDLFVWLTDAASPEDSATAFAAERFVLANLKSTVGNQNYEIPPEVAFDIGSVVIWCEPVAIAYTAASLEVPS